MAGLGYGAGRFLPQDFSSYQSMVPQQQGIMSGPPAQDQAFQPNFSQFWDPSSMLQMGAPQFNSPWYNQMSVPPNIPPSPEIQQPTPQRSRWADQLNWFGVNPPVNPYSPQQVQGAHSPLFGNRRFISMQQ